VTGDGLAVRSTGIGSWPGSDPADAIKIAFAEAPELPYLPELPARGAYAGMVGRATALLPGLSVDLQPAGWRLTDSSGRDHRLAIGTLRADLDQLEEQAQGYQGPLKYSVAGPWTLAATMERHRGDRVLADSGARRDLGQSLAEGIKAMIVEMGRRLPETEPLVQLDEPLLPSVLAGTVPTASGLTRHRAVEPPEVGEALGHLISELAPVPLLVHCCAAGPPIEVLRTAGVRGMLVDLDQLTTADWDALALGLEEGLWLGLGVRPTGRALTADQLADRALRPLRTLGVDPAYASQLLLTPACGLAGATRAEAIEALRNLHTAAGIVTDQLGA
jgi:methionine synthase II (cobalamin-independent)